MARYLRTVVHQDIAITAAGTPIEKNLGVNPLSFLLLTLRAQTLTANILPTLANLLSVLSSVDVRFKGTSIISLATVDLFRMAAALWGRFAHRENLDDDVNAVTWVTVPVPFGRIPYWNQEAFPASRAGDVVLSLTPAATFTAVASVTAQVEQIELLDAVPTQFLKYTTFPKTPSAAGEHDVDFPLGNPILGALLFGTTVPAGTSFNASIAAVKLLVDNVENYYSFANWESLHGDFLVRAHPEWELETVKFLENLAAAYTQNVETGAPAEAVRTHRQYAYLDFDPLRNGMYQLETEGRGRVHLRITADVADAIRVMPIELIKLPGAEGAAGA
jgi:hypothetical protein